MALRPTQPRTRIRIMAPAPVMAAHCTVTPLSSFSFEVSEVPQASQFISLSESRAGRRAATVTGRPGRRRARPARGRPLAAAQCDPAERLPGRPGGPGGRTVESTVITLQATVAESDSAATVLYRRAAGPAAHWQRPERHLRYGSTQSRCPRIIIRATV